MFLLLGVPTSDFLEVKAGSKLEEIEQFANGRYPLIVKPSVSYASISISDKRYWIA
jgi:D-alanine-D-alanine ligase-like ATP-grasp enzyme